MDRAREREKQELADQRRRLEASRAARTSEPIGTPASNLPATPPDLLSEVISAAGEIVTWWMID